MVDVGVRGACRRSRNRDGGRCRTLLHLPTVVAPTNPCFEAGKATKDARPTDELTIPAGMRSCDVAVVCPCDCGIRRSVFLHVLGFATNFSGMIFMPQKISRS